MIFFVLLLGILLRLLSLDQSLWLDEAAQVIESARPFSQQLDIKGDFWPPLYHLMLHFWIYVDRSETWLRLLSVSLGVVTIYCFYKLIISWISPKTSLIVCVLLAISPFHVWYSQEVRPYALSALLGILTTYFLVKQQWLKYAVCAALFIYSSYLAVFLLVAQGIYSIWFQRKEFMNWLKSIALTMIAFLPWLPSFLRQLAIGRNLTQSLPGWSDSVSTPQVKALPLVLTKFTLGRITIDNKFLYGLIVAVIFSFFSYISYRAYKNNRLTSIKILVLGGLPILFAFFTSFFLPILAPQRMIFSLPFYYLILVIGINSSRKLALLPLSAVLLVSFYSLYLYNFNTRFQRENWREAVRFVENESSGAALAVFAFPEPFAPWQWYNQRQIQSIGVAPNLIVTKNNIDQFAHQFLSYNRLFYFHYLTDLTDPEKIVPEYLQNLGFIESKKNDFPGVGFVSTYEKAFAFR